MAEKFRQQEEEFRQRQILDLSFVLVKDQAIAQSDQADKLENKASSSITIATAIITAALTVQAVVPSLHALHFPAFTGVLLQSVSLSGVALAYIITMLLGIIAFRGGRLRSIDIERLVGSYLDRKVEDMMLRVIESTLYTLEDNTRKIRRMRTFVGFTFIALWTESGFLVVFVLSHTLI